jgi:hypothetical protein
MTDRCACGNGDWCAEHLERIRAVGIRPPEPETPPEPPPGYDFRHPVLRRLPYTGRGSLGGLEQAVGDLVYTHVVLQVVAVGLLLKPRGGGWRWLVADLGLWLLRRAGCVVVKPKRGGHG